MKMKPPVSPDLPELERRSRSSLKDERVNQERALDELIDILLQVSEAKWQVLAISEDVQDGLRDVARISAPGARTRHKKFVRGLLRDQDWPALALAVEQLRAGQGAPSPKEGALAEHEKLAHALVIQGDRGLSRFLELYPGGNRTRLRQLVKNVMSSAEAKRPRARAVLQQAVLTAISESKKRESALKGPQIPSDTSTTKPVAEVEDDETDP